MNFRLALALALTACPAGSSTFGPRPAETEVATPGLITRTVTVGGARVRLAELDLRQVRLELVGQGAGYSPPVSLDDVRRRLGHELLWATNAGMFHEGGAPVGWHVEEGRQAAPLNRGTGAGNFYLAPNGVFLVDAAGARVRRTDEVQGDPVGVSLATQSGPLLCRNGVFHQAFQPSSPNRVVRSAVGVRDAHRVVFAISLDPIRFYDLAEAVCTRAGAPDALYLDGVVSAWIDPEVQVAEGPSGFSGVLVARRAAQHKR